MEKEVQPILDIEHVTVRFQNLVLFDKLSFTINKGEQWAITGPSGSGKSTLLNTINGKYNVVNGAIRYHFFEEFSAKHFIKDPLFNFRHLIALVSHHPSFRNRSNMTSFYYQQRFQAFDSNDAPTVREFLDSVIQSARRHVDNNSMRFSPQQVVDLLQLPALLNKELIKLSNGETRRLMIAEALLHQPELLLLDNPFTGLDVNTRAFFHELLRQITTAGITVILATSAHEIPESITHVLELEQQKIRSKYTRQDFLQRQKDIPAKEDQWQINRSLLNVLTGTEHADHRFKDALRMENIHVQYGTATILDQINWTVRKGEKWALLGPNGAGKSTLLSLITGDNPQAYANRIFLFDKKRGTGESIWEIKKKIGFVSPEMHQYFSSGSTCLNVVLSGFFDTMGLQRKPTNEQINIAQQWMELLSVQYLGEKKFRQASSSEQRLILLARALVKNPPLLILDEPCQGLDDQQKDHFKKTVEMVCDQPGKTLIYVTHYMEEIPACVTRLLQLENGSEKYQGTFGSSG